MQSFTNWSGSLTFTPHSIISPRSQDELCNVIHKASLSNKKVRVVGAGHSSSPLVETNDILVSLDHFNGLKSFDKENNSAEVGTAMTTHRYKKSGWHYSTRVMLMFNDWPALSQQAHMVPAKHCKILLHFCLVQP
jgi:hypothetical protein